MHNIVSLLQIIISHRSNAHKQVPTLSIIYTRPIQGVVSTLRSVLWPTKLEADYTIAESGRSRISDFVSVYADIIKEGPTTI